MVKIYNNLGLIHPKVGLMLSDSPDYVFSWFAVLKSNAIFVSIDKKFKDDVLEFVINNADIDLLFIEYEYLNRYLSNRGKFPKIKKVIV